VDPAWLDQATCEVSVVFPCLNEAAVVGDCVHDALDRLSSADISGEIIVSDNGSTDGSEAVAAGAGARVIHEPGRGYGSALRTGIRAAQGEYIVMLDADGSYDLGAITLMVQALRMGADLVMGNRFRGRLAPGAMPWAHRYIGSPILSGLLNLFFGSSVGDINCGMRAFTRDAYHRLALKTTGMEFASEMIARAARIKLHIVEVPVDYHPRAGESKLRRYRDGWRHMRFLLMYSPTWLYLIPSLLMFAVGIALLSAIAISPIQVLGRVWDMHLAALASMLCVLGTQAAWLGISARTVAVIHGFDPEDRFITAFYKRFTLERGLGLAMLFLLTGLLIGGFVVWNWAAAGFPQLDQIRPILLAVTLVIVGVQSMFNAFFLSLLGVETRAIQPG
jgi:glycosyltransferase involved in cell wall biosynthesis